MGLFTQILTNGVLTRKEQLAFIRRYNNKANFNLVVHIKNPIKELQLNHWPYSVNKAIKINFLNYKKEIHTSNVHINTITNTKQLKEHKLEFKSGKNIIIHFPMSSKLPKILKIKLKIEIIYNEEI